MTASTPRRSPERVTDVTPYLERLPEILRPLAVRGEAKRYPKNTQLIREGSRGDLLYLILSGKLQAYSADTDGRIIIYGEYGPGEYLGEMSLDGGPRSADVVTTETSVCVLIGRPLLAQHIREHPEFAFELITKVIQRARTATRTLRELALTDVQGRLKNLLESLAEDLPSDQPRRVMTRLTHQDLASRLGCSREMVTRQLAAFKRAGLLTVGPGQQLVLLRKLN